MAGALEVGLLSRWQTAINVDGVQFGTAGSYIDGNLGPPLPEGRIWDEILTTVEEVLLRWALEEAKGVRLRAADILGIHRNTLRKKQGGDS